MADQYIAGDGTGVLQSKREFKPENPARLQKRWETELSAALKARQPWIQQAQKADKRYLGEVYNNETQGAGVHRRARANLFHSNTDIVKAILFGQIPKTDVGRKWADPNDQEARCASEALERILNQDIEDDVDDFQSETKDAIHDWKVAGLGVERLRYDAEIDEVPEKLALVRGDRELAPAVPRHEKKASEKIGTEYVFWGDFVWSPCRRWKDVRWVAFRNEMTKDKADKRFAKTIAAAGPLPTVQRKNRENNESGKDIGDPWSRSEVWEIWSKDDRKVYWMCRGYSRILDTQNDPLGLRGFLPLPRPLVANATTSQFIPKPDLELDRDQYDEIDDLVDRLRRLVAQCRVTGCYDAAFPQLGRILEEAKEGQLVGVPNWSVFTEKGGLQNAMQFVPIDPIIKAIDVLSKKLVERIQLLDQIIGLSDIVRGEQTRQETATTSRLKAGFASTRLQTDQDEVARFATDLQRLRAEIISRHFDVETIIQRSNLMLVEQDPVTKQPNMPLIQKAAELIKSDVWQWRIEVKADSIALRDYAALKQERDEAIMSLAGLFQQAIPMVQIFPQAGPFLIELAKWRVAATKGSQQMEAMFDRFAAQIEQQLAQQQQQPPQPDPKLEAAKVKADAEKQKAQADVQKTQVDTQAHMQKAAMDMHVAQQTHQLDVNKLAMQTEAEAQRAALAFQNKGKPNA